MADSKIILPPGYSKLSRPPTFTRHEIGGLPVDVSDIAPPAEAPTIPPQAIIAAVTVTAVQMVAVLRELVELRERLESLEADEPPGPATVAHHSHHEPPGEPGDE